VGNGVEVLVASMGADCAKSKSTVNAGATTLITNTTAMADTACEARFHQGCGWGAARIVRMRMPSVEADAAKSTPRDTLSSIMRSRTKYARLSA
jgi:hypothetical protein